MDPKLLKFFKEIKKKGISSEKEKRMLAELNDSGVHNIDVKPGPGKSGGFKVNNNIYSYSDLFYFQDVPAASPPYHLQLSTIDDLLERDKQREKDGFPQKVRVGRLVKPGKGGKDKVVVVPTTVEEKFIHDPNAEPPEEGESAGGSEEGEVIGEQPIRSPEGEGSGVGPGDGEEGEHEMESNAYDLGKILSDQFELPNLKDKGKKRSLTRYTYDMTDIRVSDRFLTRKRPFVK